MARDGYMTVFVSEPREVNGPDERCPPLLNSRACLIRVSAKRSAFRKRLANPAETK
jgi:hypothetical protein